MPHAVIIVWLFALGACVGSFLNVVVWRLPRGESLVSPPSHCPKCNNLLKWYDNLPVIGWIKLGGRCRYCREPISPRYPIVEAAVGLMFAFYFAMFFIAQFGPCVEPSARGYGRPMAIAEDWPVFALTLYMLSALLATSLIDAELYEVPIDILWSWKGGLAWVAILAHTLVDAPDKPGNLIAGPVPAALAVGGGVGLLASVALLHFGVLPRSFAEGGPLLEVDRAVLASEAAEAQSRGEDPPPEPEQFTPGQIRREMWKEVGFLLPPMALATLWLVLTLRPGPLHRWWLGVVTIRWAGALLGSVFGLLIGGLVVWLTRIAGSLGFGREAMGMGDVHLMAGVGAAIGAGASTIAFFVAPFFGLLTALLMFLTSKRRELPYVPYLSMATACIVLFYCPIAAYLTPGLEGLAQLVAQLFGARPAW